MSASMSSLGRVWSQSRKTTPRIGLSRDKVWSRRTALDKGNEQKVNVLKKRELQLKVKIQNKESNWERNGARDKETKKGEKVVHSCRCLTAVFILHKLYHRLSSRIRQHMSVSFYCTCDTTSLALARASTICWHSFLRRTV